MVYPFEVLCLKWIQGLQLEGALTTGVMYSSQLEPRSLVGTLDMNDIIFPSKEYFTDFMSSCLPRA